jgi:hypothetical protein
MLHITALREKAKIRLEKTLAASYVIHDLRLKRLHGWPSPVHVICDAVWRQLCCVYSIWQ